MKGRAGHFLATRSLSALLVMSLVVSAFAGFILLSNPSPGQAQAIGDLVVTDGTYTIENIVQPVDGDVTVGANGELIIRDGTLSVISNSGSPRSITVEDDGVLTLDHGTVTSYLDQLNPWPYLTIVVQTGGQVMATGNSLFQFPGDIILATGAEMTLYDSDIDALPADMVSMYVPVDEQDSANDGPAITVADSTLTLFDSRIPSLPEYSDQPAKNMTFSGASTLLSVNSYISVDFGPVLSSDDWFKHNVLVLSDTSRAHLYGTSFKQYVGALSDRAPAIVAGGESYVAIPTALGPEDTTGQDVSYLQASEGITFHVAPGDRMNIDAFAAGPASAIDGATLYLRYAVAANYDGGNSIDWRLEGGSYSSTGITPVAGETAERSFDLYAGGLGVTTTGQIAALDIDFTHSGTLGDVQFDSATILISIGPEAYVYRWLNVTVGDEYGVPISGAQISSVFTGSTTFDGQPSFYFGTDGAGPLPPQAVLDYMGKDASTFAVTEADGITTVPYLTDLISGGEAPNSLFIGSFEVTGTAPTGESSTQAFSFLAYPAMDAGDQSFDFTVKLEGVVAESPDPSRWLVVPPDLLIEDMTYYHSGDVIVAADGTLHFLDAVFQLVQASPNQRTIWVDGTGTLIFENTLVTSDKQINIVVKGDATLEVIGSDLQGVDIVALENAQVTLDHATMDGTIHTAWDSHATIIVKDTELGHAPVLSGYAVGSFTNASVPSIRVEDDAIGYIYRWIHVTVYDGGNRAMPGVQVYSRYFISQEFATMAVSDEFGVARLNSLATILKSNHQSTFVGNYRVNASYWYAGVEYVSEDPVTGEPQEISIGVLPYTEPLGMNATYAALNIPDALPDLYIPLDGAVDAVPVSPRKGQTTTITAHIQNVGVVNAYDVVVEFYDNGDTIGSVTVPIIEPMPAGTSVPVEILWVADLPIAPDVHNISVVVDPANTVKEMVEDDAIGCELVTVKRLPDLSLAASDIMTSPQDAVVDVPVDLVAVVNNIGDASAYSVVVEFYNESVVPANLLGSATIDVVYAGYSSAAYVSWTPPAQMTYKIIVLVNPDFTFEETRGDNNNASKQITVLGPPDLEFGAITFSTGTEVGGGDDVVVSAPLFNLQPATVMEVGVALYIDSMAGAPVASTTVTSPLKSGLDPVMVSFTYHAPFVEADTTVTVFMVVDPADDIAETDELNNVVQRDLLIKDMRQDLTIDSDSIYFMWGGVQSDTTKNQFGRTINIRADVSNLGLKGASNFTVEFGISGTIGGNSFNWTMTPRVYAAIGAGPTAVKTVQTNWTVNITAAGTYQIWVFLDPFGNYSEKVETNNLASNDFEVTIPELLFSVTVDTTKYDAGDTVIITIKGTYVNPPKVGVPNLGSIRVELLDSRGNTVEVDDLFDLRSLNAQGSLTVEATLPSELESGQYSISVSALGSTGSSDSFDVSGVSTSRGIPLLLWIIVIIAIAGVVAGFTIYTYVYGLGKLVECGECGAFIPAASKRCPKCGVEFEVGTMKCSECGAWVPAESAECPNCGVRFVGEVSGEEDYVEKMRKEYDEMVSKYRELARAELGKKFSDKRFEEWWRQQPTYISFEDWLAKEEERRKEGAVPCPVCNTLNPKEATVCHKCGTVFGAPRVAPPVTRAPPPGGAAPPAQPAAQPYAQQPVYVERQAPPSTQAAPGQQPAVPKMVIRRPVDRKVVPKKIIRTPTGAIVETEEGQNNEEQQ